MGRHKQNTPVAPSVHDSNMGGSSTPNVPRSNSVKLTELTSEKLQEYTANGDYNDTLIEEPSQDSGELTQQTSDILQEYTANGNYNDTLIAEPSQNVVNQPGQTGDETTTSQEDTWSSQKLASQTREISEESQLDTLTSTNVAQQTNKEVNEEALTFENSHAFDQFGSNHEQYLHVKSSQSNQALRQRVNSSQDEFCRECLDSVKQGIDEISQNHDQSSSDQEEQTQERKVLSSGSQFNRDLIDLIGSQACCKKNNDRTPPSATPIIDAPEAACGGRPNNDTTPPRNPKSPIINNPNTPYKNIPPIKKNPQGQPPEGPTTGECSGGRSCTQSGRCGSNCSCGCTPNDGWLRRFAQTAKDWLSLACKKIKEVVQLAYKKTLGLAHNLLQLGQFLLQNMQNFTLSRTGLFIVIAACIMLFIYLVYAGYINFAWIKSTLEILKQMLKQLFYNPHPSFPHHFHFSLSPSFPALSPCNPFPLFPSPL